MQNKTESAPPTTDWRAVWQLLRPYWFSDEKWRARGLFFVVVALALGMVYLDVQFNAWNRDFYNALENKNFDVFKEQLWRFSYLAFIYIAVAIYRIYLMQALEIRWRTWMTNQYMQAWLDNQAYYRIEQGRTADNPDQRIAEDLQLITNGSLTLFFGLLSSVVSLASFVGILWSVSGPLTFMLSGRAVTIPGYMVWFAIAYAGLGSLIVWRIGRPLVAQNFSQQRFEADFRFGLIRIRENAESVALYRGEAQEREQLAGRFGRIRANWWNIMRTTKRLNLASTFYSQFAVIFPFLVGAPRYFGGTITLGGLMQISSAFGHVQESLSWFINAFSSLASWKASANRLAGFHAAVDAARRQETGIAVTRSSAGEIRLKQLALSLPGGQALTQAFSGAMAPGQRILVTGPSGCGKSTLFRAIADIWPYGTGAVELPRSAAMLFLPQRSYLPIGTLREAIAYPAAETAYQEADIHRFLDLCRLAHLRDKLDHADNWSQRLSPGEQQRLAFVRVFLMRPQVLFLDEATSALDAHTEDGLYQMVLSELPQATVVSIAHREMVAKFHQTSWRFVHAVGAAQEKSGEPRFAIDIVPLLAEGAAR
ncbi:putative ATP-binding cassette transporter [Noviherbaspirillum humi]|uniref:Putative ATP-binding cassette transporter n=1 Tax=Noviherbaspirillum humi TaxID=1688639 RepID=A0A239LBJ9_9BURK|nr:ABC transporter ATP-binding protein/permease [Noviherbaspirillum humi]SNT27009.1 putative ATP-binding cassette transporter [Noviherbaspirillum humi]